MPADPEVISLILPAWNEAEGLMAAIAEASSVLEDLVDRGQVAAYEIVIVDDGSTDATAALAAEAAAANPRIRTVSHDRNRGVGAAFRTGLDLVAGDIVVWTDSDMPVDLSVIAGALGIRAEQGADLVAGARSSRSSDGLVRWACTAGYDLAVNAVLGVKVDDVNFAFKLAPTSLLRSLDLRSEGAFIDAELMATVLRAGRSVVVVPMDYRPRRFGTSSTLTPRTLTRLGREFARHARRIRSIRGPADGQRSG